MLPERNPSKVAFTETMVETNIGTSAEPSGSATPPRAQTENSSAEVDSSGANAKGAQPGEASTASGATASGAAGAAVSAGNDALQAPPDRAVHARLLAALFGIFFVLWAFYAWRGYGSRHAQLGESWYVGGVHLIELTLVKEDAVNLACASDTVHKGLHCAFRGDQRTPYPDLKDATMLKPYYTVKGELLFGAGLWSSPAFQRALPRTRFTAACNYHVVGIMKAASTRWAEKGRFDPLKQSATFGYFTDCVLPE
ncbi:MAG TPA: hypothetical protein VFQ61_05870 [Polyangiaceae bacterium]|nr:hypothetical protein [Polyangiaceae bacterium]